MQLKYGDQSALCAAGLALITWDMKQLVHLPVCAGVLRTLPPPALAALQTSQLSAGFLSDVVKIEIF